MNKGILLAAGLLAATAVLFRPSDAQAISRSEVLSRAKTFSFHPWACTTANLTASCDPGYVSAYMPGDFVGLPYDWGGYMTLFEFDQAILSGKAAGSYADDGVLSCTVGLDCSGFVSKAWDSGHYTTSSLHLVSNAIDAADLLPGDVFNEAGYHVAMYSHTLANGEPVLYEALGYNVHLNTTGGWSHVDGYIPRRYTQIEGTTANDVLGSPVSPIVVSSFPYTDTRSTKDSESDLLDGCGAAPTKSESGPEYVYKMTFSKPGQLTVTIADDAGVDIDVHLYTSMSTNDCVARHDTTLTVDVDCGTYYVVADTYKGASEQPGLYTLTATFSPTGDLCGSGPPQYAPSGKMGDPCGNPNNPDLPFCNPNLGSDVCIYTDTDSFCSKPCATNADCAELAGGCCGEINPGETYCFVADLCGNPDNPPDQMGQPDAGGDPLPDGGVPGAGGSGGAGGGSQGNGGSPGAGVGGGNGNSGGGNNANNPETHAGCQSSPFDPASARPAILIAVLALSRLRRRRRAPIQ